MSPQKIFMLAKIPFFWFFYLWGHPKTLPINYTFSLTFKCNSRCLTCNIWQKKKTDDLSKEEWKRIFLSLDKSPYWVTISGGEPFLRKDLAGIVADICQTCQPKMITIPTNGLLTNKIIADVKKIVKENKNTNFIINLSLDGVEKDHDIARGIKGNFKTSLSTWDQLKKIKASNLTLGIHTVISQNNVKNFPVICDYVFDNLKPDSYVSEIAEQRKELDNFNNNITPSVSDYKKAIDYLKIRMRQKQQFSLARITKAFRLSYYDLVLRILTNKSQIIPCFAGVASAQIAPNGDLWPCCVRADILGNIKEVGYDFKKIWFSKETNTIRKQIKNKECFCPLANASYTNILLNPKSIIQVLVNLFK